MWVRSEDLLVAGGQGRLEAMTALAQFVGSTITQDELCALSIQDSIDCGESIRTASHAQILHLGVGAGDVKIITQWERQNRDDEKRKQQQQVQNAGDD